MTNVVIIEGFVGANPNIWSDDKGRKAAYLDVATNEYWRDKDTGDQRKRTEWIAVRVTNSRFVKLIDESVRKGDHVAVSGILRIVSKQGEGAGATVKSAYVCVEPYNGFFLKSAEVQNAEADAKTGTQAGEAS